MSYLSKSFITNKTSISVKDFGAVGDGITDDGPAISNAIASSANIFYPSGTYLIGSTTTFSPNIIHHFERGAKLHIPAGIVLTIGGNLDAFPEQQIFQVDGGGSVLFSTLTSPTIAHPGWWGADHTGSLDSTAAVQAAVNALPVGVGGVIKFLSGYYFISSLSISGISGIRFKGASTFATTLICSSLTGDWIIINNSGLIRFEDFEIRLPLLSNVKTSGAYFKITNSNTSTFERLRIDQPFKCFELDTTGSIYLNNIIVLPGATAAVWQSAIWLKNAVNTVLHEVLVNMGNNVTVTDGLLVVDGGCDTTIISDSQFGQVATDIGATGSPYPTNGGHCILFQNSNASFDPRWTYGVNVITEAISGVGLKITACNNLVLKNFSCATSIAGIQITGGNTIKIVDGFILQIQQHGVQIFGGQDIVIQGMNVTACSRELSDGYHGIAVGGTSKNVHLIHNTIGDIITLGVRDYNMSFGIALSSGLTDDTADYVLRHNTFGPLVANGGNIQDGDVFRGVERAEYGTRFETESTSIPADGRWNKGDIVWNLNSSNGGPSGWQCTSTGTFGGTPPTFLPLSYTTSFLTPTDANVPLSIMARDAGGATTVAGLFVGTTALYGSLGFSVGTFPAVSGLVRGEPHSVLAAVRNQIHTADLIVLQTNGLDDIALGAFDPNSGINRCVIGADGYIESRIDGYTKLVVDTTGPVIQPGAILSTLTTGNINLPNNFNSRFEVEGVSVDSTVTATNLSTLTNGSNADSLHKHTGEGSFNITALQTSLYTAFIGDLVKCDPTGGGFTVNLPTAIGHTNQSISIKNYSSSTNTIIIDAFGTETIDGSLTKTISIAYQTITVISDGSNWIII